MEINMNTFKTYHPVVNLVYFVFAIAFSVICMHPLCIAISFICSFSYLILLKKEFAKYIILLVIILTLSNPLFNHEGATILMYLPDGNPLTAESLVYGFASSAMKASVVCWFLCCTMVMTTDKLMCVFGKIHPTLSLIFSMTLRFIPRFTSQINKVIYAHRGMGIDISKGNIFRRVKTGLTVLSIMITWSAENAIDTSDSMKSRGYGVLKRTAFSIYSFKKRDTYSIICILILQAYIIWGLVNGSMNYRYFPLTDFSSDRADAFVMYLVFCIIPILMEAYETVKWNILINRR